MVLMALACMCWKAGSTPAARPVILLLHGFPELAFSWRRLMSLLLDDGYTVIAPDQRGYGRTTGWQTGYDAELAPFQLDALVDDMDALLTQLGLAAVDAVVGHDFGSPVAAWCGLIKPERFRNVVLMSAPFEGPPGLVPALKSAKER